MVEEDVNTEVVTVPLTTVLVSNEVLLRTKEVVGDETRIVVGEEDAEMMEVLRLPRVVVVAGAEEMTVEETIEVLRLLRVEVVTGEMTVEDTAVIVVGTASL